MQKLKDLPRASPCSPQDSSLDPLAGVQHLQDPQLYKIMTSSLDTLGGLTAFPAPPPPPPPHTHTTQNSALIAQGHKTVSVRICCLQNVFGQFTKPGRFFKSPRCKIGAPRRIFTYLPENIWKTTGCVTEWR